MSTTTCLLLPLFLLLRLATATTRLPSLLQPIMGDGASTVRITVLNDVPFHLEVVSGFLLALTRINHTANLDVYLKQPEDNLAAAGLFQLLGGGQMIGRLRSSVHDAPVPADVLLVLSPEYNCTSTRLFHERSAARVTLLLLHNVRDKSVAELLALRLPNVVYLTLSPHTSAYLNQHYNLSAGWVLPVAPYQPAQDGSCLHVTKGSSDSSGDGGGSSLPCGKLAGFATQVRALQQRISAVHRPAVRWSLLEPPHVHALQQLCLRPAPAPRHIPTCEVDTALTAPPGFTTSRHRAPPTSPAGTFQKYGPI
jgi:hypothetical protein